MERKLRGEIANQRESFCLISKHFMRQWMEINSDSATFIKNRLLFTDSLLLYIVDFDIALSAPIELAVSVSR